MTRRAIRAAIWCSVGFWVAEVLAYAERRGGYTHPTRHHRRRHHP